jgi:hypothetical protein
VLSGKPYYLTAPEGGQSFTLQRVPALAMAYLIATHGNAIGMQRIQKYPENLRSTEVKHLGDMNELSNCGC